MTQEMRLWSSAPQTLENCCHGRVGTSVARVIGMNRTPECDIIRFGLRPNPRFLQSLAQYPDDPTRRPAVRGAIVRGAFDDELFLVGKNLKPNIRLELFTVEHTELLADGEVDPTFRHFGLAWYHSIVEANENGILSANIRAVLLDQCLGFDARIRPAPHTPGGTFHIGLWFSESAESTAPTDRSTKKLVGAAPRGGPLAMISVPVPATGLGPLCTQPPERAGLVRTVS